MNNQILQLKIKQRLNKLDSNDYDNIDGPVGADSPLSINGIEISIPSAHPDCERASGFCGNYWGIGTCTDTIFEPYPGLIDQGCYATEDGWAGPANTPPEATMPTSIDQAVDGSGYISFQTTVSDVDLDDTRLKVEYSLFA